MTASNRPFRFYDNRQKYLQFVSTCNEKWKIAERVTQELEHIEPTPPALRVFDAGMGDGTLLSHVMRATHQKFPTVPLYVVGKEISLEDIRLSLEKLPDRFVEHPASVIVYTNLYYTEAPSLTVANPKLAKNVNWIDVPLSGETAAEFGAQMRGLEPQLVDGWQVKASEKTGNPLYVRPSIMVMYREDHRFMLDSIMPTNGAAEAKYDLALVCQPWRARMGAEFKVKNVLEPMVRSLTPGGRAIVAQSAGKDPGMELIQCIWKGLNPFIVDRHELIETLRQQMGDDHHGYKFHGVSDSEAIQSYRMHTLPDEIDSNIGTSTLFAAWNAAIYVAQIEDEMLESALTTGEYLEHTKKVLRKFGGLWFNDEVFVISKNR